MDIKDYTDMPINSKRYGGNSGSKIGIDIDGEPWMIKFPKSTNGFKNVDISYTTSCFSEYVGSHVFAIIGVPVHETKLGTYDDRLVVLCRDIIGANESNGQLTDFKSLKNAYSHELEEYLSTTNNSYANGYPLPTVKEMFEINPWMKDVPGLKEHFWDMFVVDAFIGNNDRNNENWGTLDKNGISIPAPVYDESNAFRNKAGDDQLNKTLNDSEALRNSAYISQRCFFTDENDRIINPDRYIESGQDEDCNQAVLRIVPKIDMEQIRQMIDEIPNEVNGIQIASNAQKQYAKAVMQIRYDDILYPAYQREINRIRVKEAEDNLPTTEKDDRSEDKNEEGEYSI